MTHLYIEETDDGLGIADACLDVAWQVRRVPFADRSQAVHRGTYVYVTPEITPPAPFSDALPSWNVNTPPGTACAAALRVRTVSDGDWSPFLRVGTCGSALPPPVPPGDWSGGRIDVDYLRSEHLFDRCQLRLRLTGTRDRDDRTPQPRIHRLSVALSHAASPPAPSLESTPMPTAPWARRLPVPAISQTMVGGGDVAGRICSPTSVAMVLAFYGHKIPVLDLAKQIHDPVHEIYGAWPRAVQAAFTHGLAGCVTRFDEWDSVRRLIAAGRPLIVSIRPQEGELQGAPFKSSNGHLLVLTGFDGHGGVHVNDPAGDGQDAVPRTYSQSELTRVWLANGGTAYLLWPSQR